MYFSVFLHYCICITKGFTMTTKPTERTPIKYSATNVVLRVPDQPEEHVAVPVDFLKYLREFLELKRDALDFMNIALHKTNELNKEKTKSRKKKQPEDIDQINPNFILTDFNGKQLTSIKELKRQIRKYYYQYDLVKVTKPIQLKLDQNIRDFFPKSPYFSCRIIFMDFFALEIWSIMNYLREIGVRSNIPDIIERKLLQLIIDTLHTDKNLKLTGLDLKNYVQSYPAKKLSKHNLEYGKLLLKLINTYGELRKYWIDMANTSHLFAENFEKLTYRCALLGTQFHDFKHKQTRASGGKKKAENFIAAEQMLYDFYLQICDLDISADDIYNRMYNYKTGVIFTPEYAAITPHIESQLTITKLIRKWDRERNIRRRRRSTRRIY